MNEVINNKYKLKYWFAMLYIHGRKFMIGSVFTYQRLSKDYFMLLYQNLGTIFVYPKAVTDVKNTLYYPLVLCIVPVIT